MRLVIIPYKERKKLRDDKIRALYRSGYTMDQICIAEHVSKTTVFFALNPGRSKKSVERRKIKNNLTK